MALAVPAACAGISCIAPTRALTAPAHGLAMRGEPALPSGFEHLPYADPRAPKGGRLTLGWQGGFDSLNPFIVRGLFPPGLVAYLPNWGGYVYESLMKRNLAEPFSIYGLIAESADLAADRRSVTFRLRPEARFSDGRPITPDDVVFSMELLREHGRPNYRSTFARVTQAEISGSHEVRFLLQDGTDRELPLLLGLMPILPRHAVEPDRFDETSLEPPIGSGPYTVVTVDPGASITYRRNPDYWGRDLPINRGLNNFDEIRVDFYRDANALFEAFRRGLVDIRLEDEAGRWINGYDFPAAREGRIRKEVLESKVPKGLSGLVFNTRRPVFADIRIREALLLLFDFEWVNQNLFHGAFERTQSYWEGSELSAIGRPASELEYALLAPFPDAVLPAVMDGSFRLPTTDGSGRDRAALRRALELFAQAGYAIEQGVLRNRTGEALTFEILLQTRAQERIALNYAATLKRAGIAASIRPVDTTQIEQRRKTFDFDMTPFFWAGSLSPGNEQSFRWSSQAAATEGTFNMPGVRSDAVDAMIRALLTAETPEAFVAAVRALDRVLISGFYVLPLFHRPAEWVAHWERIAHPEVAPLIGYALETWWAIDAGAKP